MKSSLIFCLMLSIQFVIAQNCNGPDHSINANDSWLSCTESLSPNIERGNSHWIMYDLGYVYHLSKTHLWNYNVTGETDKGMKTVSIDYSLDGITWTELETFELQEAPGLSSYQGEEGPSFDSAMCRYVLITGIESWGGSCIGLSEVQFTIDNVTSVLSDVEIDNIGITLYPNPTEGLFTISGLVELYEIEILDLNGSIFQSLSNVSSPVSIDLSTLPNGTYFVNIVHSSNQNLCMKKIIKH